MTRHRCRVIKAGSGVAAILVASTVVPATAEDSARKVEPLMIQEQGSFAVGGTIVTNAGTYDATNRSPAGQTLHGDHAYVFYQVPARARKLPLVFWHGIGQFSKTWETTPDGREGFQNIFLRRRFPVYLIDQPRRSARSRSPFRPRPTSSSGSASSGSALGRTSIPACSSPATRRRSISSSGRWSPTPAR